MRTLNFLFLTLFLLFTLSSEAQLLNYSGSCMSFSNYQDCAAIFYKGRSIVDEYTPKGKCEMVPNMKGILTLATVKLGEDQTTPIKQIGFKVAIKNDRTNTIWMYSDEVLQEVKFEDIIKKCEVGDRIIFMTVDQKYSLPHHEIELVWGC